MVVRTAQLEADTALCGERTDARGERHAARVTEAEGREIEHDLGVVRGKVTLERIEQVASSEVVEFTDRVQHQTFPLDAVGEDAGLAVISCCHGAIIRIAYDYRGVSFAICASTSISTFQFGSSKPATTTMVAAGDASPNTCS